METLRISWVHRGALAVVVLLGGIAFAGGSPASSSAVSAAYESLLAGQLDGVDRDRVVVKFEEGTGIRLRAGLPASDRSLATLPADVIDRDLARLRDLVAEHPGALLARRVDLAEDRLDALRVRAETRSGERLPDMNLFLEIHLPSLRDGAAERDRLAALLDRLNALEIVQVAFAAPRAEVARVERETRVPPAGLTRSTTPDFSPQQGYLYAAPPGVNATVAWGYPGGAGAGVRVIDIEYGWRFSHEDLKDPFFTAGDPGTDDHGTAVMGEISGIANGLGVTGIANDVEIGGSSIVSQSVAQAILTAAGALQPGDIFVIELHAIGPFDKYVPMEYWQDNFDAIRIGTAAGILCCEAAGNGSENLDFVGYHGVFDRRVRDSGAILCGAGTPQGLTGEWFTNYGSRVDLEGWGSSVTTTGYGDLWNTGPDTTYTSGFNGTSSATPIVTGSVASLQGQARALFGAPLSPGLAQEILSRTGSPYTGTKAIGERPDLAAARPLLEQGFATVDVTVRDAQTLLPLEGIVVELVETGRLAVTPAEGSVRFQMSAGSYTLHASSFFYTPTDLPVTVVAGEDQNLTLDLPAASTGGIQGFVYDQNLGHLPGARVECLDTPLALVLSGMDGHYRFDGVPEGPGYRFVAGGVPGRSNLFTLTDVVGGEVPTWSPVLIDAQTFEANNGGYTGMGQWQWGTPSGPGPHSGYSGTKCWKTNLTGYYGNYQWINLESPTYNFAAAERLLLSFHHWYWIEAYQDGGNVQVWFNGAWHVVEPVAGYDIGLIAVLEAGPGFTGASDGWEDEVFDITAYKSATTKVIFRFASGPSGTGPGWYIDDVAFDTYAGSQSVDLAPGDSDGPTGIPGLRLQLARPSPSPALGATRIGFRLSADADVTLSVLDATGRRVRALHQGPMRAGEHTIAWDGFEDTGAAAAAGVYYVRLEAMGRSETRPIVRMK
jgi:hypothetical protein